MAQNQTLVTKSPTNPYGNSPKSLSSPVPDTSFDDELALAMGAASRAPAAAPAQADPFEAELQAALGAAPAVAADEAALSALAATQGEVVPQVAAQAAEGADLLTQFRASFAGNDAEKLAFLEKQFGPGNARVGPEGKLQFSKDGKNFKNFNSQLFGKFADMFVPSGRQAVKELALLGPEVAGGVIGAGIAAPTVVGAPAGAIGGGAAARMAFTPSVNRLADSVAEFMGIPQDPTRNKEMENVIEQSVEALGPAAALVGKSVLQKVGKKIPGTSLNRAVKAEAAAADIYDIDQHGKQLIADVQTLKAAGLEAQLLNSSYNPRSKPLQDALAGVKNNKEIQASVVRMGEQARDNIEQTMRSMVDMKLAAKAADGRIGTQVTSAARAIRDAEGAEIRQFKNQAIANSRNAPIPPPQALTGAFGDILTGLGIPPAKLDRLTAKDLQAMQGKLGITKISDLRSFTNALNLVYKKSNQGQGIRLGDMDEVVKVAGDLSDKAQTLGSFGKQWGAFTGELRRFKNAAIDANLPDDVAKQAFASVNSKYGSRLEAVRNIENLISDDMGSHIVVDQLLGKGKEAVGNARNLKAILPAETFEKLRGEWVEKQLLDFRGPKGDYDAKGLAAHLEKNLGPEFVEVMFDGNRKKIGELQAALRVGQAVAEKPLLPNGQIAPDELKETFKQGVLAMAGSAFLKARATVEQVFKGGQKGKEQDMIKALLTNEGFERYISGLPQAQRGPLSKKLNEMRDYAVSTGLIGPLRTAARGAQDLTGRKLLQDTRSYLGGTGQQPQYQTPIEGGEEE